MHELAQDTLRATTLPFVDRPALVSQLDSLPDRHATELPALEALLMALTSLTILDQRYFSGSAPLA